MPNIADAERFVLPLLKHLLGQGAEKVVARRMTDAEGQIVEGMQAKEMVPPLVTVAVASRDALFRLWKAVVRSGDIADLIRDHLSDAVTAAVVAEVGADPTPSAIVTATRNAALREVFET